MHKFQVSTSLCRQEGLLTPTAQRAVCETWNAHHFYCGSMPLGPNFTGTGSSSAKIFIGLPFALQLCRWKFLDNEILYQTFSGFCRHLCEKRNGKFGYFNPFLGKSGVMHDLFEGLLESPWLSIHFNWTYFAMYYGRLLGLWSEMCTARLFSQGRLLCTEIFPGQGRSPSTILGIRKLETLGYPTVKTASLCVPSFWYNTGVWRTDILTDGRTDGFVVFADVKF